MTAMKGIDASYATLTDEIAQRLRATGEEVFAQCLWTGGERPAPAIDNLVVAAAAGFVTVGYISVAPHHHGAWHAQQGRDGVPGDVWNALALAPIDVELRGTSPEFVRFAVEKVATFGKRRALYTSPGYWRGDMNDDQSFGDCLVWVATWDNDADVAHVDLPGGWTPAQVVGKQWAPGGDVEGLNADRDTFVREVLLEEVDMDAPTKGEFGALFKYTTETDHVIASVLLDMARHLYTEDEPELHALEARLDELHTTIDNAHEHAANAVRILDGLQPAGTAPAPAPE